MNHQKSPLKVQLQSLNIDSLLLTHEFILFFPYASDKILGQPPFSLPFNYSHSSFPTLMLPL